MRGSTFGSRKIKKKKKNDGNNPWPLAFCVVAADLLLGVERIVSFAVES